MSIIRPVATLITGVIALCSGCGHMPGMNPGWSAGGDLASNDRYTFVSTPHAPQTITIIDTRSGEIIWSRDVPVGQQLNLRFVPEANEDNPVRPDVMKYGVTEAGRRFARLTDSITVPAADSRRIDVELRKGPEFPR